MWQKQLKKLKNQVTAQASSIRKPAATAEIQEISFSAYCQQQQISRLSNDTVTLVMPRKQKSAVIQAERHSTSYLELFDEESAPSEFFRFGQHQLPKELRNGKFSLSAILDLHNYNRAQALELLANFIEQNGHTGCVKIIHGQGLNSEFNKPILLGAIRKYLEYHPQVVGYSHGTPQQGGAGVTLVKLKAL